MVLSLRRGDFTLDLAPETGGAISAFSWRGQPLLRPAPTGGTVLDMASFPLVPFANRIGFGRLRWGESQFDLPLNLPGEPHALHGQGWQSEWSIESRSEDAAVLTFMGGAGWPWPFEARQTFALEPDGLHQTLSLTNLSDQIAPCGLGFHPYFPADEDSRLVARLTGVWLSDETNLPSRHLQGWPLVDWRWGAGFPPERIIDHCHTGWDGVALFNPGPDRPSLRLTAGPDISRLHVYAPPGEGYVCLEPVTHRPNAINAPDPEAEGLVTLAPGETRTIWMRLSLLT